MNKKVSTGLKSLFIIIIAVLLISILGFGSITKFVFKQILFTPYNIVGIVMTIFTICGGYITKRQGHWVLLTLTILSGLVSVFSFVTTVLSWFDIHLWSLLWNNILKPAVITIGTVLLWIILGAIALALIGFIIYGIIKLICYIKEEKEWKLNNIVYQKQKTLVEKIARENYTPNVKPQAKVEKNKSILYESQEKVEIKQSNNSSKIIDENKIVETKQVEDQITLPDDFELKISNNICPVCGWYLKKRINSQTGEQFRGCTNFAYHDCTFTIPDDEYIRIYKKYH